MSEPPAPDWGPLHAPSVDDFERLAREAFSRLPAAFTARCQGIAFLVLDFPDDDMLEALDLESPFDLLGLYEGVDLTRASGGDTPGDLNRIYLFRRPLLLEWSEGEDTLGALVTNVLVHEIGHHFGLSDEEMEAIEAAAD